MNLLSTPIISYNFLKKILKKIKNQIIEIKLPKEKRLEILCETYKSVGLNENRDLHILKLNKILKSLGLNEYEEEYGMYSEHLVLFSAISSTSNVFNNILEIGTYDGKCTTILASLFPDSKINTIDLRDDDHVFINTYNRQNEIDDFIKNRNERLEKHSNINFLQGNSLELTFTKSLGNQNLIWVDGAHGYPYVPADITNCLRILSRKGILMCYDVWKKVSNSDSMYQSIATFETLSAYENAKIIETTFFSKRIGKKYNYNYKNVSFSKLSDNFNSNLK